MKSNQYELQREVREWCDVRAHAVTEPLIQKDEAATRARLSRAWEDHRQADFTPDQSRGAWYHLIHLQYHVDRTFAGVARAQEIFGWARGQLEVPAEGPLSELLRRVILLQVLISGERLGYCQVAREELSDTLDGIPEDERDAQLWYYISSWAYTHRDAEYLRSAYEMMLTMPTDFQNQYPFRRTQLMYWIVSGQLDRLRVEQYLNNMYFESELWEFKHYFERELEQKGVLDPDLCQLIESTQARLSAPAPAQASAV